MTDLAPFEAWIDTPKGLTAYCEDKIGAVATFFRVDRMQARKLYDEYLDVLVARYPSGPDGRAKFHGPQVCGWCGGLYDSIDALVAHESFCSYNPEKSIDPRSLIGRR